MNGSQHTINKHHSTSDFLVISSAPRAHWCKDKYWKAIFGPMNMHEFGLMRFLVNGDVNLADNWMGIQQNNVVYSWQAAWCSRLTYPQLTWEPIFYVVFFMQRYIFAERSYVRQTYLICAVVRASGNPIYHLIALGKVQENIGVCLRLCARRRRGCLTFQSRCAAYLHSIAYGGGRKKCK